MLNDLYRDVKNYKYIFFSCIKINFGNKKYKNIYKTRKTVLELEN